ncbi:MAG: putative motility protein [Clostridiales bacterium]|nr:putative motility protein [Clostridiales bacterium]
MQISSLPISSSSSLSNVDVSIAVLAKNLDTIETLGRDMIRMMEQSLSPHLGQSIDIRV